MPTDLACKHCKGTGKITTANRPSPTPCPVCGGSGVAVWAVEVAAKVLGRLLQDADEKGVSLVGFAALRSSFVVPQMLASVREEAKNQ